MIYKVTSGFKIHVDLSSRVNLKSITVDGPATPQYGAHRIRDGKIGRFPSFHHLPRCPDRFPMVFDVFFIVFA